MGHGGLLWQGSCLSHKYLIDKGLLACILPGVSPSFASVAQGLRNLPRPSLD